MELVQEPMIFIAVRDASLSVVTGLLNYISEEYVKSTFFNGHNLAQWSVIHARKDVYELLLARFGPSLFLHGPLKDVLNMNYCLAISAELPLIDFVLQHESQEDKEASEKEILEKITHLIINTTSYSSDFRPNLKLKEKCKVLKVIEKRLQKGNTYSDNLMCQLFFNMKFDKLSYLCKIGFDMNNDNILEFLKNDDESEVVVNFLKKVLRPGFFDCFLNELAKQDERSYKLIVKFAKFGYKVPQRAIHRVINRAKPEEVIKFITELFAYQPLDKLIWTSLKKNLFLCKINERLFDEGNVIRCNKECETNNLFPVAFKIWIYRQMYGPPKLVDIALLNVWKSLNEVSANTLKSVLPDVFIRRLMPHEHPGNQCDFDETSDRNI